MSTVEQEQDDRNEVQTPTLRPNRSNFNGATAK